MQKRFIASIFLLMFIGLLAGCNTTYVHDSITKEGSIAPEAKLYVETFNGNVSVVPTQGKNIEVEIEKWATGDQKEVIHDFLLGEEIIDDGIIESGVTKIIMSRKNPAEPNPAGITNFGVNVTIKIPTGTVKRVEILTSNGSVRVDGVSEGVTVTTSNAGVDLIRNKGNMIVRTSQGAVNIADVEGNLDVETSNEAVNVKTPKVLKVVKITTSNGKIDYQSLVDSIAGSYSLETSNHSIDMTVPTTSKLSFHAVTSNGNITCKLPITDTNPDAQILEGNLNAGGAAVNLTTSNGDINIFEEGK